MKKKYTPYIFVIVTTILWYALGMLVDRNSGYIQDLLESLLILVAWTVVPFFLGYFFAKLYTQASLQQTPTQPTLPSKKHLFFFAFITSLLTPLLFLGAGALIARQPIQVTMPLLFTAFVIVSNSIFALFFLWGIRRGEEKSSKPLRPTCG